MQPKTANEVIAKGKHILVTYIMKLDLRDEEFAAMGKHITVAYVTKPRPSHACLWHRDLFARERTAEGIVSACSRTQARRSWQRSFPRLW